MNDRGQMKLSSTFIMFLTLFAPVSAKCGLPIEVFSPVAICHVVLEPRVYVGKSIRVQGKLKTDGRHYTYIVDESCGDDRNAIDIGDAFGNKEYDELIGEWERACSERGEFGLCVVEVPVDVLGVVRKFEDGLLIDIKRISEVRPWHVMLLRTRIHTGRPPQGTYMSMFRRIDCFRIPKGRVGYLVQIARTLEFREEMRATMPEVERIRTNSQ